MNSGSLWRAVSKKQETALERRGEDPQLLLQKERGGSSHRRVHAMAEPEPTSNITVPDIPEGDD